LDFLCISEHNHVSAEGTGDDPAKLHIAKDHTLYSGAQPASLISTAKRVNTQFAGSFVALYGQEFSVIAKGNHLNVFDVGEVIDEAVIPNRAFDKLYGTWLPAHLDTSGKLPMVQFNHPAKVTEDYGILKYPDQAAFVAAVQPYARTIAIVSGPHDTKPGAPPAHNDHFDTAAYFHYLNLGLQLAPAMDGDNHFITFGTSTEHRTAVWAPELTREAILTAIRENHVYATQDKNLVVDFRINNQIMGAKLRAQAGDPLTISVQLSDPDEPAAKYHVTLFHDTVGDAVEASEIEHDDLTGNGTITFDPQKYIGGIEYYLVHVEQSGTGKTDHAWTAPIWISVDEDHIPTPIDSPGFVWSVNSKVFHIAGCKDAAKILDVNRRTGTTAPDGKTLHKNCPLH
jgi:hypothetical protein